MVKKTHIFLIAVMASVGIGIMFAIAGIGATERELLKEERLEANDLWYQDNDITNPREILKEKTLEIEQEQYILTETRLAEKLAKKWLAEDGMVPESGMSALETLERVNNKNTVDVNEQATVIEYWENSKGKFDGMYLSTEAINEYRISFYEFALFLSEFNDGELDTVMSEIKTKLDFYDIYLYEDLEECFDEALMIDDVKDLSNFCLITIDESWNELTGLQSDEVGYNQLKPINTANAQQCRFYEEKLDTVYETSVRFEELCKNAQFGSYSDFYDFSSKMQIVDDLLLESGSSAQEVNNLSWELFDVVEDMCSDNTGLQTKASSVQFQFSLMSLCFEDMYEEFGEFPGMELGLSPDYFDYNSKITANNDQCLLFCDSYGYEPYWVKSMGEYQVITKCTVIFNNSESANPDDLSWCYELTGYMVG